MEVLVNANTEPKHTVSFEVKLACRLFTVTTTEALEELQVPEDAVTVKVVVVVAVSVAIGLAILALFNGADGLQLYVNPVDGGKQTPNRMSGLFCELIILVIVQPCTPSS